MQVEGIVTVIEVPVVFISQSIMFCASRAYAEGSEIRNPHVSHNHVLTSNDRKRGFLNV